MISTSSRAWVSCAPALLFLASCATPSPEAPRVDAPIVTPTTSPPPPTTTSTAPAWSPVASATASTPPAPSASAPPPPREPAVVVPAAKTAAPASGMPEDCEDICAIGARCTIGHVKDGSACGDWCTRTQDIEGYACFALNAGDCDKMVACWKKRPKKAPRRRGEEGRTGKPGH
jgi:hypothetical protein